MINKNYTVHYFWKHLTLLLVPKPFAQLRNTFYFLHDYNLICSASWWIQQLHWKKSSYRREHASQLGVNSLNRQLRSQSVIFTCFVLYLENRKDLKWTSKKYWITQTPLASGYTAWNLWKHTVCLCALGIDITLTLSRLTRSCMECLVTASTVLWVGTLN